MNKFMKSYLLLAILVYCTISSSMAQTGSATLTIGKIDISNLKPGDKVKIPLKMTNFTGGLVLGFQLFVGFDHEFLTWDGTLENPSPGVEKFDKNLPFRPDAWMFNDNASQIVSLWGDPELKGIALPETLIFCNLVFTYKGGLQSGMSSPLTWGDTYKDVDGLLVQGKTEMFDEKTNNYQLTLINGELVN